MLTTWQRCLVGQEFGGDEHGGGRVLKRPRPSDAGAELEPSALMDETTLATMAVIAMAAAAG
jgi:hypothetical protein